MEIHNKPHLGKRIGATILDYGLMFSVFLIYVRQYGTYDSIEGNYSVHGFKSLPLLVFWLIYFVFVEFKTGSTLGHYIFGLKVIDSNGGKTRVVQNLKRHLIDFIDIFMWGIPALIAIKNTENNQRLGDLWAKTVVIHSTDKIFQDFYNRPEEEQEYFAENTWCPNCKKADLGINNPVEYKRNGKFYIAGECKSCGLEIVTEIKIETLKK
jgi:uncharacterized RDD family membrane protein YckC